MKNIYSKFLIIIILAVTSSCKLDPIDNPNAPTVGSFENGATQQDLYLLTAGLEAVMRSDLSFHYQTVSILGREYNDLTQVDPRYTGELLIGPLDNNGFLTTRAYGAWYKIVHSANILITATENSNANLDQAGINGYLGYAKTLKGYALMMVALRQYSDGIRVDVADPNNLGPFVSYTAALTAVRSLLDEANTELLAAGAEFDFALSSGFTGFDTPATFAEFNRAIAARTAMYQGNKADVLTLLASSFMDLAGNLNTGPAHVFGLTGNDISNSLFYIPNQDRFMAHDSFVADAEAGDTRVTSKVQLFNPPDDDPDVGPITVSFDGLTGDYQVVLYSSNTDPVSIIRNEELILLYAEANIGTNNAEALTALNTIRAAAGLGASAAATDAELEDEMLTQRRYSLFGEGHRWVDLRRYNRLGDLPIQRAGDSNLDSFPTPFEEL